MIISFHNTLIIINATKDIAIPTTHFMFIRSRKNTADIMLDKINEPPCAKGYSCDAGKYSAATVLKYEYKNKHTDIINMYTDIGFISVFVFLSEKLQNT